MGEVQSIKRIQIGVLALVMTFAMGFLAMGTQQAYAADLQAGGALTTQSAAPQFSTPQSVSLYVGDSKTVTVTDRNTAILQSGTWTAVSSNAAVATVTPPSAVVSKPVPATYRPLTQNFVIKGVKAGTAKITVTFKNDKGFSSEQIFNVTVQNKPVVLKNNTVTFKNQSKTVKYAKLKKKNQTVSFTKATAAAASKSTIKYTITKVSKSKFKKKFSISKSTKPSITLKKGLAKGTYKITVKATATAKNTSAYKKTGTATKVITVKVK